ncbi:hypothetical protein [Actinoplanes sp. TFC3]|uniref:hypothetical protein n=1 Tax=Actinoplanes sp. TFC3 TaxID=1710355 RepID=UPI00082F9AB8|nr:hypothetical protein [Actinoplanes sp. TFC3]
MMEPVEPWWAQVHEAAQLLTSNLGAAVTRAGRDGVYHPPPGRPVPKRRRRPASLRHLAEVIGTHRLAPGLSMDKDVVGAVLAGDLRYLTNPIAVVAVARAAQLIAGDPPDTAAERQLSVASERVAALVKSAEEADQRAPRLLPEPVLEGELQPAPTRTEVIERPLPIDRPVRNPRRPLLIMLAVALVLGVGVGTFLVLRDDPDKSDAACTAGADPGEIIIGTPTTFDDKAATRLDPTLDFDAMNGSARYARRNGRTYYWGRAGSDDNAPEAGGSRIRWRFTDGPWHSCGTDLAVDNRNYVHSPAVPTTINGRAVTLQVCLWRADPYRENCTPEIKTG